jgi:hypothetical protein
MTIIRDRHASDLAEKALSEDSRRFEKIPEDSRSGKEEEEVGRHRGGTQDNVFKKKKCGVVVTLDTLRALPENQEVTLYLDVVSTPTSPKMCTNHKNNNNNQNHNNNTINNNNKVVKEKQTSTDDFCKLLKIPCPNLDLLIQTLEQKIVVQEKKKKITNNNAFKSKVPLLKVVESGKEEIVATLSECVIVRKQKVDPRRFQKIPEDSRTMGAAVVGVAAAVSPPPPLPTSKGNRQDVPTKVEATIDECLIGKNMKYQVELNIMQEM